MSHNIIHVARRGPAGNPAASPAADAGGRIASSRARRLRPV